MGAEAVNRIWTYFGTFTLTWAVLGAVRVRATEIDVAVPILAKLKIPELVMFTIPIVAVCILLLHWLLRANARANAAKPPAARLPVAWLKSNDIDPMTSGGRLYLWTIFWLFAVIPIVGLAFVLSRFIDGTATYASNGLPFAHGWKQFWPTPAAPLTMIFGDHIRFEAGPTYLVWITPYLYVGLWVSCVISAARLYRWYRPIRTA